MPKLVARHQFQHSELLIKCSLVSFENGGNESRSKVGDQSVFVCWNFRYFIQKGNWKVPNGSTISSIYLVADSELKDEV